MSERVPCVQCGTDDFETVFTHRNGQVANGFCRCCGLGFLSPRPTAEETDRLYADYRQAYPDDFLADPKGPFARAAESRARFIAGWVAPRARVLEIGCGYGHFTRAVSDRGFRASGLEPSEPQRAFARDRLGLDSVAAGRLEDAPRDQGNDVAAMFHVIEHLRDPQEALRRLAEAVRPGGLVFLDLPDASELPCDAIEHLYVVGAHHLYSFTPRVLAAMAARAGLETLYLAREPLPAVYAANLRLVARRVGDPVSGPEPRPEETRASMTAHHRRLAALGERVRSTIEGWRREGHRIAIYGAGYHTLGLIDLCDLAPTDIEGLIDDDPEKHGTRLAGLPVFGPECLRNGTIDAVLVSSLAAEDAILARLQPLVARGIRVQGVYGSPGRRESAGPGPGSGGAVRRYTRWMRSTRRRDGDGDGDREPIKRPDLGLEVR